METEPKPYTIAEMSRRFNVSLRTLRFYEEKGLLQPGRRRTDRFYGERDCVRLELVLRARKLGFTLTEILHLIADRASPHDTISDCLDIRVIDARLRDLEADRARIASAIAELESLRAVTVGAHSNISRWLEEHAA